MEILKIHNNPERAEWAALTERFTREEEEITRQVTEILADVKSGGDRSLREVTRRVEGRDPRTFEIPADVRAAAAALIPAALKEALAAAKANIETFHRAQLPPEVDIETMPGVRCVQRAVPIRRVGLYIPGGKAPLFSTVLMLAVPARVAGCGEVILCTPARPDGTIAPEILYAADLCSVDRIFSVGGAQAVAAMAYGTESIPRVDKIFGPGNRYVTKAKQLVGANDVAVDLPAGPSEVLVLADDEASPAFAAADLLSQAEHGGDSQTVLVCPSVEFARDTQRAVGEQLLQLRRGETIREALRRLEQEHLIADTGKGTVVLGITAEDLVDIMDIRCKIEGLASYYAAKNASPEGLARLQHILDLQEFYFEKRDAEHLREMDDQFHDIICDMSGHAVISDTLVPLHRKTRRKASIADAKRTAQVVKEHRAIYEAIAAGDADAAAALTTEHTIHAKKSMIERMDLHG